MTLRTSPPTSIAVVSWRWLDGHHLDETVRAEEVVGVAGVEARGMGMGCRGNQQIHAPSARLATGLDHRSGQLTIARRHRVIHG